jgi:hypothetical protein
VSVLAVIVRYFIYILSLPFFVCTFQLHLYAEESSKIIDASNWESFSQFLIEPLAKSIALEGIYLDYNSSLESYSIPSPTQNQVVHDNSLMHDGTLYVGELDTLPFPEILTMYADKESLPYKIFWNAQSVRERVRGVLGLYRVNYFPTFLSTPNARPAYQNQNTKTTQILYGQSRILSTIIESTQEGQEKEGESSTEETIVPSEFFHYFSFMKFLSPASVSNLSFFYSSVASSGSYKDKFRIYSPIFKACRELHNENMSDRLLDMPFSFEDMSFFSESPMQFQLTYVADKEIFVPRVRVSFEKWNELSEYKQMPSCEGKEIENEGQKVSVQKLPSKPNSKGAHPRAYQVGKEGAWILKSVSRSPLTEGAYSYYFVGKDSLLPYYKIQYDFTGKPMRFTIASWDSVYKKGKEYAPILLSLDSFDLTGESMVSVEMLGFSKGVKGSCFEQTYEALCPTEKKQ